MHPNPRCIGKPLWAAPTHMHCLVVFGPYLMTMDWISVFSQWQVNPLEINENVIGKGDGSEIKVDKRHKFAL